MTNQPMEPVAPEVVTEAEQLYAAFYGLEPNRVITYGAMDLLLGRDVRSNRTPVYRFNTLLLKRMKRTLKCIPGVGYRIIEAREHAEVADARRARARRQAKRGIDAAKNVRYDELTLTEKQEVTDCLTRLGRVYQATIARCPHYRDDDDSAERADAAIRNGRHPDEVPASI